MTMETVLQIAAVCLVGAVLAAVLRQRSPEAALLLGLAVCAVVGALLLRGLADVLDMLEDLAAAGGLPPELLAPWASPWCPGWAPRSAGTRDRGPWRRCWRLPGPSVRCWCPCPWSGRRGSC